MPISRQSLFSRHQRKRKKATPDEARLRFLAQPARKPGDPELDPFRVRQSALVYELTERMRSLAVRQNPLPQPFYRQPGKVVPEALEAVGEFFICFFLVSSV